MKKYETSLADRLAAAGKAKRVQIERARASAPGNDPGFADRQAARHAAAIARAARISQRKAVKLADKARIAEEETARAIALIAEEERRNAEVLEQGNREVALAAERKAARDARYAARKVRQKRK